MIISIDKNDNQKVFDNISDAHNCYKGISEKWIQRCIDKGIKYKGLHFIKVKSFSKLSIETISEKENKTPLDVVIDANLSETESKFIKKIQIKAITKFIDNLLRYICQNKLKGNDVDTIIKHLANEKNYYKFIDKSYY